MLSRRVILSGVMAAACVPHVARSGAASALRPELAAFQALLGHCWVGTSSEGKPDTHCFESVFDGMLVRDRHVVPGKPPYRGETIYYWNAAAKRIDYAYVNSFGDEYRGVALAAPRGIDFAGPGAGQPVTIRWRWAGRDAYVVTAEGRGPIRFVRERQVVSRPVRRPPLRPRRARWCGAASWG